MDFKESLAILEFGGHGKEVGHELMNFTKRKKSLEKQLQKVTNFNPEENQKACEQFFFANSLKPGKFIQ